MKLKPLAGLTNTLRTLLKIELGILAIAILVEIYGYYSYAKLPAHFDPSKILLPSDTLISIVTIIQIIFSIITGITFLIWIYRTNKNLHQVSGQSMVFAPNWAVAWYFVPIANLFKPYQVMKELWKTSHKNQTSSLTLLGWWWTLWLISNFIGQLLLRVNPFSEDAAGHAKLVITYGFSDGVNVILNIVALILVSRISTAYSKNFPETESNI